MEDLIHAAGGAHALSDREVAALAEAAGRYLRDREAEMAGLGPGAAAQTRREHFRDCYDALEKLGFRLPRPPGL